MNNRKKYRILIRRATAEQWTSFNPLLMEGELGMELDTFVISEGVKLYKFKVGNGETYWNDLEYCSFGTNNGGGGGGGTVYWNDIQNKPTTFAPAPHTHPISEVVDLSTTLAAKADLSGGKLVSSQLPAIAISEFLGSVANQSAMLSLIGQVGDWCIRTDEEKAYVITGGDPTQLASWTAIVTPASPVTSVNGQIGEVVLGKADIGLENVDNTRDVDKPISDATQLALDAKMTTATYDTDGDGIVDKAEAIPIIVSNSTGATLIKGQIVYLSGSTGNRPNAVLAQADQESTSSKTIGMVVDDIANNTDGLVACIGTLHNQNTNSYNAGDTLWLSATTPGEMVANTPPAEPNHAVFIGFVARSHPTEGRVVLAVQNGYELNELHGVSVPTPNDGDSLVFNDSTKLWEATKIVSRSFLGCLWAGLSVTGGGTNYGGLLFPTSLVASLLESSRLFIVPYNCTLSRFYVRINTIQPSSGSLILTIRKNLADSPIVVTFEPNAPVGSVRFDITNQVSLNAGDTISIKVQNNASAASAQIHNVSIMVTI